MRSIGMEWCALALLASAASLNAQTRAHGVQSCGGNKPPVVQTGFSFSCNCTVIDNGGVAEQWKFHSEPRVESVDGEGPAASFLQPGDRIAAADGQPITTTRGEDAFSRMMRGATVRLTVRRRGGLYDATIAPLTRCPERDEDRTITAGTRSGDFRLGMTHGQLNQSYLGLALASRATVTEEEGADPVWHFEEPPVVVAVAPGGPAATAGLQTGDTLTHVDSHPITSEEAGRRFGAARSGETLTLGVRRNGTTRTVRMTVGDRPDAIETPESGPETSGQMRVVDFSVQLGATIVDVTGPTTMERVGDRLIIHTKDGKVTVVVRPAVRAK